ncbi:phage tail protein [Lacrimispora defluvii]|uniref:Phage tail protein n=1 Tax=Lacrimispora defluvii TaxID=2719233 RepID=A0ABX1VP48_9FIRM|nr:phage tail protein [Lacrimispora defluvii]NNJ28682.1 phage tail protein [Lacrimispora defluvii]
MLYRGRYEDAEHLHKRIGKKPQSEFLNPNLQGLTFTIVLNAQHGVRPRKTLEAIEKAIESGRVESLVIGAAKVGKNKWKITQMSETWDTILAHGELVKASLNLTLEEYL